MQYIRLFYTNSMDKNFQKILKGLNKELLENTKSTNSKNLILLNLFFNLVLWISYRLLDEETKKIILKLKKIFLIISVLYFIKLLLVKELQIFYQQNSFILIIFVKK